jgi:hypothetical protein
MFIDLDGALSNRAGINAKCQAFGVNPSAVCGYTHGAINIRPLRGYFS